MGRLIHFTDFQSSDDKALDPSWYFSKCYFGSAYRRWEISEECILNEYPYCLAIAYKLMNQGEEESYRRKGAVRRFIEQRLEGEVILKVNQESRWNGHYTEYLGQWVFYFENETDRMAFQIRFGDITEAVKSA